MKSYSTICIISALSVLVGLTTIGCTSTPIAAVPASQKSEPIVAASTPIDRPTIAPPEAADPPITNDITTTNPSETVKTAETQTTSTITRKQAIDMIAELPEIGAWREYVNQKTAGKVRTTLSVNPETPTTYAGQEYWSVSFYENQPTHRSRWQSFLVRLDGQEILVDDLDGKYRNLENWRQQDKPMARVGKPTIESASEKQLPFVGTKRFNFLGGSGTGQSITIGADGRTTIKLHGTMNTSVQYSGAFTNPIVVENGNGLLFKNDKVYRVSPDGQIIKSCDGKATCEAALD